MRTNRMRLTTILSIALVVVPGAVAAQAADEASVGPTHYTSTETQGDRFAVTVPIEFFDWGYRNTFGLTYDLEADDPRAAGTVSIVFVLDQPRESAMARGTGLARLVNEGGSFEGPLHVAYYPDGSEFRMSLMEGHGGYEGLTMSMTKYIDPNGEGQTQGFIWEGEAPPIPDASLLPE